MIQQFTFDGKGRQIDAQGVFFRYESGADPGGITDLRLMIDGNSVGTYAPGDAIEFPIPGKRWELLPVSTNCTGLVKIGNGRITSSKLSGVVSVAGLVDVSGSLVDVYDDRLGHARAGRAYGVAIGAATSGPGNSGFVRLKNPANSQYQAIVTGFGVTGVGGSIIIVRLKPDLFGGAFLRNGLNKLIGGPASVCELHYSSEATFGNGQYDYYIIRGNDTPDYVQLPEPIVINPGNQIEVMGPNNGDMQVSFNWIETQTAPQYN